MEWNQRNENSNQWCWICNPPGRHGGRGSTKTHNEILKIIDSAPDYESFVRELNEWVSKRMKNGVQDLPEGLRR